MANTRDRDNPSSPRSSAGGADSFKGTPDTRLTAFSPENTSTKTSKSLQGLVCSVSAIPPVGLSTGTYRNAASLLDKDPFVTPSHLSRLSPTASAFCPFTGNTKKPLRDEGGPIAAALSSELGLSRHLRISSPVPISVSDVNIWLCVRESPSDCPRTVCLI